MPRPPLAVAVVWHMHQPWYRDDAAGEFVLPWVRRRATKDYLHMLRILERHPDVRVTMNMVPSLLAQLEIYAAGGAADAERELCLRSATELTPADRAFLVASAQREDYGRRVALFVPYMELLSRLADAEDSSAASVEDIRDLQLWTLLLAIEPGWIRDDADLLALARRGRGFRELDKVLVDAHQLSLMQSVIPAYCDSLTAGRVEAMTSPYHHPILPLLIDAASARVATPDLELASPPLHAEADAAEHVRSGREHFVRITAHEAAGMWPPECAVSPAAAALMQACGVRFAVSDEGVLARTLQCDDVRDDAQLYHPHADASGLTLVFRDAQLSNLIGFSYQSMPADDAAADLVARLEQIAADDRGDDSARLVTIALDGENFKDFYEENATPFLDAFYAGLVSSPVLQSTHIGAFLDAHPQSVRPLPELWSGSWIDADLRTWIGEPAHTRAWTLVASTRVALGRAGGAAAHPRAHEELLIAEGSDWYWWFGRRHDSGSDAAWDALFRTHLRNAHVFAGLDVPTELERPVLGCVTVGNDCRPLRAIDPPANGPAEWRSAGTAEVGAALGSMRPPASSVSRILYGAGGGRLHLRFGDSQPRFDRLAVDAGPAGRLVVERPVRNLAIALRDKGADFSVLLEESGRGIERVPASGELHVRAPNAGAARPLRVLVAAAECAPLAVAGSLAGVVADTAAAAAALGHDVVVVLPKHRSASLGEDPGVRLPELRAASGGRPVTARVVQGVLPGPGVPVLSVDAPSHFDRAAPYGDCDDGERYLAFCALVEALLDATAFVPDVVHGFEWQMAALIAALAHGDKPPATIFSVDDGSPGYRVGAAALGRVPGERGEAHVDLLDLGREAATVVAASPPSGGLADLYRTALELAASSP
ncbi:MAG: glycogen/starch synthase [Candidatus Dormibacteraeota bacterium]|nr:glycogen/starch synthase [Candidatus Dormibacteraeota bacterium]